MLAGDVDMSEVPIEYVADSSCGLPRQLRDVSSGFGICQSSKTMLFPVKTDCASASHVLSALPR